MIIILGLAVVTVVGILLAVCCYNDVAESVGLVCAVVGGVLLTMALVILPINYYGGVSNVQRYEAFKKSVEKARANGASEAERTAILMQITRWNEDLASTKYWNNTVFDVFINDKLAELPYLE